MAKTKVSQWDSVAANNTDINSININEGCPPSTINNAIRETMAQIKNWQDGSSGDGWTSTGTITAASVLNVTGSLQLDGAVGTSGQVLVSSGSSATPTWGSGFPTGGIILWSGATSAIPSGWALCNGSSGTPDLRNRFVVGAGSTYAVNATGGSADATLPSHNHSFSDTTSDAGSHTHYVVSSNTSSSASFGTNSAMTWASAGGLGNSDYRGGATSGTANRGKSNSAPNHNHSVSGNTSTSGASATNANLPPYYALAYIMKL